MEIKTFPLADPKLENGLLDVHREISMRQLVDAWVWKPIGEAHPKEALCSHGHQSGYSAKDKLSRRVSSH